MDIKVKFSIGDVAFIKEGGRFLPCEIISLFLCKYYTIGNRLVTRISYNIYCNNKLTTANEEQLFTESEKE